jgi:hypothetical protein
VIAEDDLESKLCAVTDDFRSLSDPELKRREVLTARQVTRLERAIGALHDAARRTGNRVRRPLDAEGLLALYDAASVAERTIHAIRREQQRRLLAEIVETYGSNASPAALRP